MKPLILAVTLAIICGGRAQAQDTARSPDGRYAISIVSNGEGDENGSGVQAIVLYGVKNKVQRRLLVSKWNEDYAQNLVGLSRPLFSLDGGYVYFSSSDASPNSGYVHQVDLKLNIIKAICPGSALRIIRTGPYRGYLLVQSHRYRDSPEGGELQSRLPDPSLG